MTEQSFIEAIAPNAVEAGHKYHILPSLIMAQAILESKWGNSGLTQAAHNLFGVKGSYNGVSVTMPTKEYINGSWQEVNAEFKKYPSWEESFEDLCQLYNNGLSWDRNHYVKVVGETDYKKACQEVQKAGYATDPNYATLLSGLIEEYNLTHFDGVSVEDVKPSTASEGDETIHTVKSGDTLSEIAQAHDTTVQVLMSLNPQIKDADVIFPGQNIKCPGGEEKAATGEKKRVYQVKKGDTFSEIAQRLYPSLNPYRGGMDKLANMNPQIKHIGSLSVGEVIYY